MKPILLICMLWISCIEAQDSTYIDSKFKGMPDLSRVLHDEVSAEELEAFLLEVQDAAAAMDYDLELQILKNAYLTGQNAGLKYCRYEMDLDSMFMVFIEESKIELDKKYLKESDKRKSRRLEIKKH